jgi:hypothetical protein
VVLAEAFGANRGTYTVALTCTDPAGLVHRSRAETAIYAVPDAPERVTCTFTNTRTSATITLQKAWVDGAAGDAADLSVSGSEPGTAGTATSRATGTAGSETDTVNSVTEPIYSGETVDLVENLSGDNTGSYRSDITCSPGEGFTPGDGGQGGSYQVPADPGPVTCTITNTRTSASLVLQKRWVNGAIGDTADLSIDGASTGPGSVTATVPTSGTGLSTGKSTSTILSGGTIVLAESLGTGNVGRYTSQIVCDQPGLTPDSDGRGGTFEVPITPEPVTCTVTNTAPPTAPAVTKSVASNTQNADDSWTTVYDVVVTNAATAAPTRYRLTDTLAFGAGIRVDEATVTGPPDETLNPGWNGRTDTTIVADATIGTGETDHYTVTVNATVTAEATADDVTCSTGGGLLNRAQVRVVPTVGTASPAARAAADDEQDASACADAVLPAAVGPAALPGTPPRSGTLPSTGGVSADLLRTALMLIALGALVLASSRRRNRRGIDVDTDHDRERRG